MTTRRRATTGRASTNGGAVNPEATPAAPQPGPFRARIRMYRQGLGDCYLITLPRQGGGDYFMLIDCGVLLGTPDAEAIMQQVMSDILATTGGRIDLLVATHEHWDHLSGFVQAADLFQQLTIGAVWLAWTEDPDDALARRLRDEREATLALVRQSATRALLIGDEAGERLRGLLTFAGAATGPSTHDALEAVRARTTSPRYCRPQDAPVQPPELGGVRFYVLGPPPDERLIKRTAPSARDPETYGAALAEFRATVAPVLTDASVEPPFGPRYAIPTRAAQQMDFFHRRYWASESWRRIDTDWLDGASELALQLDNATNNTSLVLAIELTDGNVLLFAADAQVGNWLSWQELTWTVNGGTVTGPDLLKRTLVYKVGHHGSHNATLKEKGLELMGRLGVALLSVNEEMAHKQRWMRMPLPALVEALAQQTHGAVVRADEPVPAGVAARVTEHDLYFDLEI